jgi:hypothetical protein
VWIGAGHSDDSRADDSRVGPLPGRVQRGRPAAEFITGSGLPKSGLAESF